MGGFGAALGLPLETGFGTGVLLCFVDFDRRFMREALLAGFAGVIGVESGMVEVLFKEMLRRRLFSASFIDCSDNPEGKGSSRTGEITIFSTLLRVNIERSPPFDSFL
jgi:hypothetical protein